MYFQPNSCNTHAERDWARGTFLRQRRKVPPAHAQQVSRAILSTIYPYHTMAVGCIKHWIVLSYSVPLGCDFVRSHTNTQIRIRRFSIVRGFFTFATVFCVFFSVKKPILLVNAQIHITKRPAFHSSIRKKLKFIRRTNICSAWNIHLCNEYTRCTWAGGTFLRCLLKVPWAQSRSACVLQELGWKYT